LFNIFLHAQGSMGLVSMHMHLSAAFNNPCVVLAAGREPASFTQYYGHQYVHNNGALPCVETKACWACKLKDVGIWSNHLIHQQKVIILQKSS
jgi:ADP-heptose:LPS heptosyltransferase